MENKKIAQLIRAYASLLGFVIVVITMIIKCSNGEY
jgi:hypothetical protein